MNTARPAPATDSFRSPTTPRQPNAYSTRARARRLEAEGQRDSARQAGEGRCDCGLALPCGTCAREHTAKVAGAFEGLS